MCVAFAVTGPWSGSTNRAIRKRFVSSLDDDGLREVVDVFDHLPAPRCLAAVVA
jgi:hypothetical protein